MYIDFQPQKKQINNYFNIRDYRLMYNYAKNRLSKKRFEHCQSCGRMLYDLDNSLGECTAMVLGLGHDLTKEMDMQVAKEIIYKNKISLYTGEMENIKTLHAVTGYHIFRQLFPKAPLEFAFAIRHHSVLSSQYNSFLAYNLFTADKIEYTRENITEQFRRRIMSEYNSEIRILYLLDVNGNYLKSKNKKLLDCSENLYNELKEKYCGKQDNNKKFH